MSGSYTYPNVGRAGLGNMMLPWARAEAFRHQHGLPMLAPQWTQLKLGPLLRREQDLRFYTGLFQQEGYIRGLRRFLLLRTAQRVPESEAAAWLQAESSKRKNALIEFAGLGEFFQPLLPYREYLKQRLQQIITPAVQAEIDGEEIDFEIACHIRRGDKPTMTLGQSIKPGHWHNALPLQWFVNVIHGIRATLGREAKVCIFSDGRDDQLEECLALPGVRRANPKSSIADILTMAKASILVTTGTSSFSGWAAFLGHMPSLWYPTLSELFRLGDDGRTFEANLLGEFDERICGELLQSAGN